MPEGPEAHITAHDLNSSHTSQRPLRLEAEPVDKNKYLTSDGFTWLNSTLEEHPYRVTRVFALGKKVVFQLDTDDKQYEVYVVFSLGLTGVWGYTKDAYNKLTMVFDEGSSLYFSDRLNFATMEVYSSFDTLYQRLYDLGPDLITTDIPLEEFMSHLSRYAKKTIADTLLDTSFTSTIGNYLRSEVLYYSCIYPFKTVVEMTRSEVELLHHYIHELPRQSYVRGGPTIRDYRSPHGVYGSFPLAVYDKKQDPNGYQVVKATDKNKRSIYYVPELQGDH